MAEACVKKDDKANWTDLKPLKPNTDCSGNNSTGSVYVLGDANSRVRSRFEVRPTSTVGNTAEYSSKGIVEIYGTGGSTVTASYTDSISAYSAKGESVSKLRWLYGSKPMGGYGSMCVAPMSDTNSTLCWGLMGSYGGASGVVWSNSHSAMLAILPTYPYVYDTGGSSWKKVTADHLSACGIASNNKAFCWGNNSDTASSTALSGQVGNNKTHATGGYRSYSYPEPVFGPLPTTRWLDISAGNQHACGIDTTEALYCWGKNDVGQTGLGTTGTTYAPVKINVPSSTTKWKQVESFDSSNCAVTTTNQIYCWGSGAAGQIGNSGTSNRNTPTLVSSVSGVTGWQKIEIFWNNVCALSISGTPSNNNQVYCWGNTALANGATTASTVTRPSKVTNPTGVTSWKDFAVSFQAGCGLANNDQIYCWGSNEGGKLGRTDGTIYNFSFSSSAEQIIKPAEVAGWKEVSFSRRHGCAVAYSNNDAANDPDNKVNDRVYCWGEVTRQKYIINTNDPPQDGYFYTKAIPIKVGVDTSYLPGKFIRF